MTTHTRVVYPVLLSLLLAGAAAGAEVGALELGRVLHGDAPAGQLSQQVVVLVHFSLDEREARSRQALEQVIELQAGAACEELLVLANHTGETAEAEVRAFGRERELALTVLTGAKVGAESPRAGYAWVFAQGGAQAFRGRADDELREAVLTALDAARPVLGAGLGERKIQKIAAEAEAKGNYGRQLKTLERIAGSGEGAEQEEAARLAARIERLGAKLVAAAEEELLAHPSLGVDRLEELEDAFSGTPTGDGVKGRLRELKRDHEFKKELKADRILQRVLALLRGVHTCASCGGGGGAISFSDTDEEEEDAFLLMAPLGCTGCRQNNRQAVGAIEAGVAKLRKRYPETMAGRRAAELAEAGRSGGGFSFGPE